MSGCSLQMEFVTLNSKVTQNGKQPFSILRLVLRTILATSALSCSYQCCKTVAE